MTKPPGGSDGDDPPKPPERPDPFAPLPLADLPPVRRRGPLDPQDASPKAPSTAKSSKSEGTSSAPPDKRSTTSPGRQPPPAASAPQDKHAPGAPPLQPDTRSADASISSTSTPGSTGGDPGAQPSGAAPMSWTDMPAPGAQTGAGVGPGTQPTEASGAMSWTDMPEPGAQSGGGGRMQSPTESAAMSWTDMPAPQVQEQQVQEQQVPGQQISGQQMPGQQMSEAPDTRASDGGAELPLLPSTYDPDDLRAAVGATPAATATPKPSRWTRRAKTDDDDDSDDGDGTSKPRSRKMMLFGALTLVAGGGIAAMIIVGKVNSERYLITCEADRVLVQQGRSFPPWGESTLEGAEWKALKIPPEAPCAPYETENKAELAARYFKILREHATSLLTAREVTKIDEAEAQLKQALLVARSFQTDDDRINARDEVERLLGDVVYWRASAKLRSASEALTEAAKQFEIAAQQRPRHVTDAAAWALYVRKLVEELRAGPAGVTPSTFPPLPPGERPTAPPGVALPIEPGAGSGSATAVEPLPPPPTDAGLPTGGVLL